MINKVFYSILIVCIFSLLINTVISAEETGSPYLSESIVNIEVDNNKNYEINQDITISNIHSLEENEITHTLSNINNVEINDLEIKTGDNELEFSFEEKSSFKKYSLLIPDNQDSDFSYQISYKTHLEPDEFTTPLFVPEFSSMGEENVVNINFKAPEG